MNREHPAEELKQLLDERWGEPPAERASKTPQGQQEHVNPRRTVMTSETETIHTVTDELTYDPLPPHVRLTATYPAGSKPERLEVVWEYDQPSHQDLMHLVAILKPASGFAHLSFPAFSDEQLAAWEREILAEDKAEAETDDCGEQVGTTEDEPEAGSAKPVAADLTGVPAA